ncbi:MAG: hypothetical protein V1659_05000 [Candidatus Woesearchaeota archaeon]
MNRNLFIQSSALALHGNGKNYEFLHSSSQRLALFRDSLTGKRVINRS